MRTRRAAGAPCSVGQCNFNSPQVTSAVSSSRPGQGLISMFAARSSSTSKATTSSSEGGCSPAKLGSNQLPASSSRISAKSRRAAQPRPLVVRDSAESCMRMATRSRVSFTSNSTIWQPCSAALRIEARGVFRSVGGSTAMTQDERDRQGRRLGAPRLPDRPAFIRHPPTLRTRSSMLLSSGPTSNRATGKGA